MTAEAPGTNDNAARVHNPALAIALSAAVPLRIAAYRQHGGPDAEDLERARRHSLVVAEKGDVLQYGGKDGEAAELFNSLADALAIMAFCPGGVDFAGDHYEATP